MVIVPNRRWGYRHRKHSTSLAKYLGGDLSISRRNVCHFRRVRRVSDVCRGLILSFLRFVMVPTHSVSNDLYRTEQHPEKGYIDIYVGLNSDW